MQRTTKDKQRHGDPAPLRRDDKEDKKIRRFPDSEKNPFGPDRHQEEDGDPTVGGGGTGGRDW